MPEPTKAKIRKWRQYLADERAEGSVYRDLASRRDGEEKEILLALADAEQRHEAHWLELLGDHVGKPRRGALRTRSLGWLARRFGSVFVLALAQRAEARSPYEDDSDATPQMAADETIHEEVVRGLALRGRQRLSGSFRAAVFGANDGLVSNLALIIGIGATGVSSTVILATGISGLLAGALSMGAGEFVSVRSQRELLAASNPAPDADDALKHLDVNANELELVYRARGMSQAQAHDRASRIMAGLKVTPETITEDDDHEEIGSALSAAISSFCFFASGAVIPILPYIFRASGLTAVIISVVLVGLALLGTGGVVGVLSGGHPLKRGLRQLAIGFGAAAVTYLLGLGFGAIES